MKGFKITTVIVLALAVSLCMIPLMGQAKTAKKVDVQVVSKITTNFKSNATKFKKTCNVKYKDGLVTHYEDANGIFNMTYTKDNKIKKRVETDNDSDKIVYNYTFKKGKVVKDGKSKECIYKDIFKSKAQKIVSAVLMIKDKGDKKFVKIPCKYSYKNDRVVKAVGDYGDFKAVDKYTYDKKGNMVKNVEKAGSKTTEKINAKIKYKNGLAVKIMTKVIKPNMGAPINYSRTFKYKTIKVNEDALKLVERQQWQVVNSDVVQGFVW